MKENFEMNPALENFIAGFAEVLIVIVFILISK